MKLFSKWFVEILEYLNSVGVVRYSEIKKDFPGITPKVLCNNLKKLVGLGFVKNEKDDFDFHSYYFITFKGAQALVLILKLKSLMEREK